MKVVSLFGGIECGRIALEELGIHVDKYYSSEIDPYAIKVSSKNYPDIIHLGDATKWQDWDLNWEEIDVLLAGFPCFTKGTLVLTSEGLKPIESIQKGDLVLTHNHRYRSVVTPMSKMSNHYNLLKIQGSHLLKVTDEHPFYVRKMERKWDNGIRSYTRRFSKPEWVKCKDLDKSCFIGVGINQNSIAPEFNSSEGFWSLIGRYLADGYSSTDKLQGIKRVRRVYKTVITCGKHKEDFMDTLLLNSGYEATKSHERTAIKYIITNKELWEFVQAFGRRADNKEIPGFVFDMPINLIKSLIDGYISGDGHKVKERVRGNINQLKATSVSEKLVYGLQQLIQKAYNTHPSITYTKRAPTHIIEGRVVNQRDTYVISFNKEVPKLANYFVEDGFIWTPFKSIEKLDEKIEVFNFEVEEDNSYTVNNLIVHNCQAWSIAGTQGGVLDERGRLLYTMMDILNHIRTKNPNIKFLFENVKMKKEFLDLVNETIGVSPIEINSRLLTAQNRPRIYWTNIEGVTIPADQGIILKDILEDEVDEKYNLSDKAVDYMGRLRNGKPRWEYHKNPLNGKAACLTANMYKGVPYGVIQELSRKLTPLECERLQGIKDGYTEGVSSTQRYKCIGNGWSVPVIKHILKNLK